MNQNHEALDRSQEQSRLAMLIPDKLKVPAVTLLAAGSLLTAKAVIDTPIAAAQDQVSAGGEVNVGNGPSTQAPTTPPEATPAPQAPVVKQPAKQPSKNDTTHKEQKHTPKKHPFFDMNQKNGSICGPTSGAMVYSSLTGNRHINQFNVAKRMGKDDYKGNGGGGILHDDVFVRLAPSYGLVGKSSNFTGARNSIKKGGLAIIHARPGHFTGYGHFMVLRSYKSGRFRIADPNNKPGRDSERKSGWTPNQLRHAGIDKVWTFRKK